MEVIDISLGRMCILYAMLLVPVALCRYYQLGLLRDMSIAIVRMSVQLVLVALYLQVLFDVNSPLLNIGWMLIMIVVANVTISRNAGLRVKRMFPSLLAGLLAGTFGVVAVFVLAAVRPVPLLDARYLIPVTGMVLGNCLRANVVSLERFYTAIRKNEREFLSYLLMGASLPEALRPYTREALRAATAPTIATMATLGLVSLPGMMTGQILGGSLPVVAIKYQIGIMLAIFCATMITAALNLRLSCRIAFNSYQMLDKSIFRA